MAQTFILGALLCNILVTIITSTVFQYHANQLQETANIIAQRNQQPDFQIESIYQDNLLIGYTLIISNGQPKHMDVQLERFIHLDTKGSLTPSECYIPYNDITTYCADPTNTVFLDLYPKDTSRDGLISPIDASGFIRSIGSALKNKDQIYMFQTLDILTLNYTDYSRIRRTEKYILYTPQLDLPCDDYGNQIGCYLYPLSEEMMSQIESMIPQNFTRSYGNTDINSFLLPNDLYSYVDSNDYLNSRSFGYSRDNMLVKATFEYLSSLGFQP